MERIAARFYDDAAPVLPGLWTRMMEVLALGDDESRHRPDANWADDALNSPVERLFKLLMKDPTKNGLAPGAGYPVHWIARLDQLLDLPGDMRRHTLVMISFQLPWLFAIDPAWTERQLLPAAENSGPDGDAFWDGVLWAAQMPSRELFARLKAGLIARASQPHAHRDHSDIMAGLLLGAWGGAEGAAEPVRLISDIELREVLIEGDDQLRGQIIWHLEHWLAGDKGRWYRHVIPFLNQVWPKQRALHTPSLSARLTDFALASGDLMPAVIELILPRLVPIRMGSLRMLLLKDGSEDYQVQRYPRATLDLLWAVLTEDPLFWPYKIEDVLDYLATVPETSGDPRLSELRRRRER